MIPNPLNTALLNDIESKIDNLNMLNKDNQDAYYALGYITSLMVTHLRGESKAAQKRFLADIEYFLKVSKERYAKPTEQNVIYERVS